LLGVNITRPLLPGSPNKSNADLLQISVPKTEKATLLSQCGFCFYGCRRPQFILSGVEGTPAHFRVQYNRPCGYQRNAMEEIDITGISFDSFVSFMFDRPVPQEGQRKCWYWSVEAVFDPAQFASYYVKLFSEPRFLLQTFSKPQLEEGFWAIPSCTLNCSVRELIWMDDLDFTIRAGCVRAMYYLFERLFAIEHLETSANMWWDALCYDWHCGNRSRSRGGEDELMQDVMFETLAQVLNLESAQCQGDALHGLGHLHHPSTDKLIEQYIASHSTLTPEMKKYALAAAEFQVL
jgi:hypothetical protein